MCVSRNSSRIACFSHWCTTTSSPTTLGDPSLAAVEQVDRLAHAHRGLGLGHDRGHVVTVLPERVDLRFEVGTSAWRELPPHVEAGVGSERGPSRRRVRDELREPVQHELEPVVGWVSARRTWSAPAGP